MGHYTLVYGCEVNDMNETEFEHLKQWVDRRVDLKIEQDQIVDDQVLSDIVQQKIEVVDRVAKTAMVHVGT